MIKLKSNTVVRKDDDLDFDRELTELREKIVNLNHQVSKAQRKHKLLTGRNYYC